MTHLTDEPMTSEMPTQGVLLSWETASEQGLFEQDTPHITAETA